MRRVLEQREFEQLAALARLLAIQAAGHEHDLTALVESLQRAPAVASGITSVADLAQPADATTAGVVSFAGVDLIERIRALCVNAREHRLRVEEYLERLTGKGSSAGDGTSDDSIRTRPRVLIVDDAEDVREILEIALEAEGIETITAADGLEGLVAAHIARPEVVLMDVNMPVLNGIDATRLLKAGAATRHVAVIAHTSRPDLLADPIARQFDLMLKKPMVPGQIVSAIRRLLADRGPSARAEGSQTT